MEKLANWLISALAIFALALYLPGFEVDSFITALIVAFALGIVNAVIKPVLIIFTLPITILTLGLFSFVINALLIWGVAYFVPGFTISGFAPALIAAVILWLINTLISISIFPVKAAK